MTGGETEESVSGWTIDTLHAHIDKVLEHMDLRYQQRFDAQQQQLTTVPPVSQQIGQLRTRVDGFGELMESKFVTYRTLIDSQAEKVALALASADKAVGKAEVSFERQVAALAASTDQLRIAITEFVRADFLQQALASRDALIQACTERIRELELARSGGEGGRAKATDQRAFIASMVGVVGLIITIVVVVANILSSKG